MNRYDLVAARDGDVLRTSFVAEDRESAERKALELMSAEFRCTWATYDDAAGDSDGTVLEETYDETVPVVTMALYRALADGLSDMVEEGRLREGHIPDDYQWLAEQLAQIAAADPVVSA